MNVLGIQISRVELTARQKWTRRVAILGTGSLLLIGGGVAYAFWTTTASGSGTGAALTLTVTANAPAGPTVTNQLYPGNTATAVTGGTGGDLVVNVTYLKGPSLKATSVVQAGPVTVDAGHVASCSSDSGTAPNITAIGQSGVYVGTSKPTTGSPPTYTSYAIPVASQPTLTPNASAQNLTLPFVLSMDTTSVTGCQGATFSVPVTVSFSS